MAEPITYTMKQNETLKPFTETGFSNPDGLRFAYWNTERDGSGKTYTDGQTISESGNLTLYAQWGCMIDWNAQGGTTPSPYLRQMNSQIGTLPTSTKSGYDFGGWFTEPSGGTSISETTLVTSNATYYAKWIGKTYTLVDPNWLRCENGTFSGKLSLFKKIPTGQYNLKFKKMNIVHYGDTTQDKLWMFLFVENASNVNKFKYLDVTQSNTTIQDNPSGIRFSSKQINTSVSGTVQRQTVSSLYGTGYSKDSGSGYFTLTVKNITLPYTSTNLYLSMYPDGYDQDCKGGAIRFADGSVKPTITLTRI